MDQKLDKITFARLLRYHQTEVEKLLWAKLRDKRLVGVKFRRQQTIGPYIVDFVSFERKLIIELDGGHHNTNMGKQRDSNRTQWLKSQGFEVGMADKNVAQALAVAYDSTKDAVLKQYSKLGEMGSVAEVLSAKRKAQKSKLTVTDVFEVLTTIASTGGEGSVE